MTPDILLTLNSLLLAGVTILVAVVGYFLKDLHDQFQTLTERVSDLMTDLIRVDTRTDLNHRHLREEIRQKTAAPQQKTA